MCVRDKSWTDRWRPVEEKKVCFFYLVMQGRRFMLPTKSFHTIILTHTHIFRDRPEAANSGSVDSMALVLLIPGQSVACVGKRMQAPTWHARTAVALHC